MDRYDIAVQNEVNALWDWDLITSRMHYSPGWVSMIGCAGIQIGNTTEEWFKRVHPDEIESIQNIIDQHILQGKTQFELQHRMLHQDGCYRWMSCIGAIARDSNGRAVRISGSHKDITARKVADELTGLPNRFLLIERLTRSIEKAQKHQDFVFAVLMLDLDLFESGISRLETINPDSIIIAAARRLEVSMQIETDSARNRSHLISRSGGEQFIILLDGLSSSGEAKIIGDGLLRKMLTPFDFEGREVLLSPSIGIALSATGHDTAEEVLRDSDTALYRARALGKSRCEVFDTAVLKSEHEWNLLEEDLQGALTRNEFEVYYQPIVSLSANRIDGFEALVRWNHPKRGLMMPGQFLPVAEKAGLIAAIDRMVWHEVCQQLANWKGDPNIPQDPWISVNLSGAQLKDSSLLKEIHGLISAAGIDASRLMLEVTEESVIDNPEAVRNLLMQLRVLGTRIGLDDFGTGYSSLAQLHRFPLDYLKIDRSFISNIDHKDTLGIVRAISTMARQLQLRVIAEGIETPRQVEVLRSLECEYGQGFLFSKAVTKSKAKELLTNGIAVTERIAEEMEVPDRSAEPQLSMAKSTLSKHKFLLAALPAIILLLLGGLLAGLDRMASPSVAPTTSAIRPSSPPESAFPAPKTQGTITSSLPQANPQGKTSRQENSLPKSGTATLESSSYSVIHDHRIGNCRGILKFYQNKAYFISEKVKDSFDLDYSDFTASLDKSGDHLIIKSGSKNYRFTSGRAANAAESKKHLLTMYQSISRRATARKQTQSR